MIHRHGPWRGIEAVEFATLEWVHWFNHRRSLEPIGNIPPAEAEDRYYAKLEATPIAAQESDKIASGITRGGSLGPIGRRVFSFSSCS